MIVEINNFIIVRDLDGLDLVRWLSAAVNLGKDCKRPDFYPHSIMDVASLLDELSSVARITIEPTGTAIDIPEFGRVAYKGDPAMAISKCYIAWKLGDCFYDTSDDLLTVH